VLQTFQNVSFLDVALVQETLGRLGRQVGLAFRALAGFILAGGTLVLFAALLTSRFKRRRESALLKTLGATGSVIRGILLSEYGALGGISAAGGLLLGGGGGHLLLGWQFDLEGNVPWWVLAILWTAILLLSVGVGWSVSGPVLRAAPLDTIREDGR
jgi:putative ABC transport system permease protein